MAEAAETGRALLDLVWRTHRAAYEALRRRKAERQVADALAFYDTAELLRALRRAAAPERPGA
jgi:hypothetical protein